MAAHASFQPIPRVHRAAIVIECETADGQLARLVYAFDPAHPITLDFEPLYPDDPFGRVAFLPPSYATKLTVEGETLGGRMWTGPMPGDDVPEVEPQRRELGAGG